MTAFRNAAEAAGWRDLRSPGSSSGEYFWLSRSDIGFGASLKVRLRPTPSGSEVEVRIECTAASCAPKRAPMAKNYDDNSPG